jgi:hypothetical protein
VARRFPEGVKPSPWVAHARGARYEVAGTIPTNAARAAQAALQSTYVLESFGCVDLMRDAKGRWLVLEVGTDGVFNHVDRDIGDANMEREIQRRIAEAFWAKFGAPPWSPGEWHPKE